MFEAVDVPLFHLLLNCLRDGFLSDSGVSVLTYSWFAPEAYLILESESFVGHFLRLKGILLYFGTLG